MRKKIIVRGPALSQSGYGEHTRFLLRSLRRHEDRFDIYLVTVGWGQTGWIWDDGEERKWLDGVIKKTHQAIEQKMPFDISVQVTIPNEWEKLAPINIGVTAGIETTKVAPVWLEKANMMDKVITISRHSKEIFEKTSYKDTNEEGQEIVLTCQTPIEIVHYPIKKVEPVDLGLELDYNFNYLLVAQWGPRKNFLNTIKWWVEENFDQKVGLIVKTSVKNNSVMDRVYVEKHLIKFIKSINMPERKCKVYMLHGDMLEEEIQHLYVNPKIKVIISLSHGEGFGLPLFDAACNALPVIAPGWSGHCDFLYMPAKDKTKTMFANVNYDLSPVQEEAVWEGVLQKDSMWCFAHEGSYKMRLRQLRKNYSKWKKKAEMLKKWIDVEFAADKQYEKFADEIYKEEAFELDEWIQQLETEAVEYE